MATPSPGPRAGEGPGVGALPPAGRHVALAVRAGAAGGSQRDAGWGDGLWRLWGGAEGGTWHRSLSPSCPGDHRISEDIASGELRPP